MDCLPEPRIDGRVSLEESIHRRRSVREFVSDELTPQQISQLAWAAQGITQPDEQLRAVPSAGGLYPLDLYLVRRKGVDRYLPDEHALECVAFDDVRPRLAAAALDQEFVAEAPLDMVITATFSRLERRYGGRAERYAVLEAGQVGQNILLMAVALGLGAVPVGAYEDHQVARILKLRKGEEPLYIIPIGVPRS